MSVHRRILVVAVASAMMLAGCEDEMSHQPRYDGYEPSRLFSNRSSLQAPPEDTLAQDTPGRQQALDEAPPITGALLARGRERFGIFCAPCHGLAGDADGTVPSRGFPRPPSMHEERLRAATSAYFVDVISHGHGVMYAYADRVAPADRWAVAAYIRALQLSQAAPADLLTPAERRQLDKGGR